MAIEIVDFLIKNGDFPIAMLSLPEGNDDIISAMIRVTWKE